MDGILKYISAWYVLELTSHLQWPSYKLSVETFDVYSSVYRLRQLSHHSCFIIVLYILILPIHILFLYCIHTRTSRNYCSVWSVLLESRDCIIDKSNILIFFKPLNQWRGYRTWEKTNSVTQTAWTTDNRRRMETVGKEKGLIWGLFREAAMPRTMWPWLC
jgi:hypothetical protein